MRIPCHRVAPVLLGDAEASSITSERSQPGRQRDRGGAVGRQLLGLGPGQPDHRVLGQVVEERVAVVVGVVLGRAVGHLDQQSAGARDQQRQRVVAGDEVRVERQAQQPQSRSSRSCSHTGLSHSKRCSRAPDVVDQHVEPALLGARCAHQRAHLVATRWSTATAMPVPPAAVTSSAVSSIVSGRSTSERRRACCARSRRPSRPPRPGRPRCHGRRPASRPPRAPPCPRSVPPSGGLSTTPPRLPCAPPVRGRRPRCAGRRSA